MLQLARAVFQPVAAVKDQFTSMSVGSVLVLKACGFIEAHNAEIVDVSEQLLHVRMGQNWLRRLFRKHSDRKPLEVRLAIRDVSEEERDQHRHRLPAASYCSIDVLIRPLSREWSPESFQQEARRLLWSLRSHFMAC